jgi:peptide/nickel transport system substrate-binding protein
VSDIVWKSVPAPPRGIVRRNFLAGATSVGLSAGVINAAVAQSPAPKRGGHLRLGLAGASTTDNHDSGRWADTYMFVIGYATKGSLVEIAPDGAIRPELADSWGPSDGAKTWTFKLRKGVEFSNGKSFTAEDVVASINHHRGEASRSSAKAVYAAISEVKADGKDAVAISLDAPNQDFPYFFTDPAFHIMPAKDGQADWASGIGAGPYILEEFAPGVRATLKRNPNSYKSGHLDSAELIAISDVNARQAALTGGQVDIINRADLKTAALLGRRRGIRIEEVSGRLHYSLSMNTSIDPYSNRDLRTALKHAIDREALLKTVFHGYGQVGNDQPITPSYRYYNSNLAPPPYDPDKARFFLKKSGFDAIPIAYHTSEIAFAGALDFATLYQQQAAKAGINLNVVREPADGYWSRARNLPWYTTYWSGRATEDVILTVIYSENSPWNNSRWRNPEFNKILVAARSEVDEGRRGTLYHEMQRLISEDGGTVIPLFAKFVNAVSDKVRHGPIVASNMDLDGNRILERWWIEH